MDFFSSSSKKDEKPKEVVTIAKTGKFVDGQIPLCPSLFLSFFSVLLIIENVKIFKMIMLTCGISCGFH